MILPKIKNYEASEISESEYFHAMPPPYGSPRYGKWTGFWCIRIKFGSLELAIANKPINSRNSSKQQSVIFISRFVYRKSKKRSHKSILSDLQSELQLGCEIP